MISQDALSNNCPTFYAQIVLKVFIDLKIIYNMVRSINEIVDGISYESSTAFKNKHILVLLMSWGYLSEVEHTIKAWLPTVAHRKMFAYSITRRNATTKKWRRAKKRRWKITKSLWSGKEMLRKMG